MVGEPCLSRASCSRGYSPHRDNWAKTVSANKDIKVFIGAPASPSGAGTGYVDSYTLAHYAKHAQKTWSSFGGVMLWEASLAVRQCESVFAARSLVLMCMIVPQRIMTTTRP